MRRYNRLLACILIATTVSTVFTGCGTGSDDGRNDNIVLQTPVGVTAEYDIVTERDMYQVDVYPSSVNPVVTEYSFEKNQTFKSYGATPGKTVKAGDTLVYSETKTMTDEVKQMEKNLADTESYHLIQSETYTKEIEAAKKNEYKAAEPYMEMFKVEPEKESPMYDAWETLLMRPEANYKRAKQSRERLEQNYKQYEELYTLEHDYLLGNIQRVKDKITEATIVSDVNGEVVACNYYSDGDYLEKDKAVIAIGDTTQRVLQTEYISKGNITKALDYYAVIDGKRYELDYVNMDPEEHKQLTDAGESVCTSFILNDPSGEVQIGTYAAVIVIKDRRNKVPCVPVDSIKKESDGYYAYVYNGDTTLYVKVEIGMKDGLYAEVLSGLSVGDKVLSSRAPKKTANTAQVTRGDYILETDMNGFMYYPFSEWITNPVENGTAYLKEILVSTDQKVEKDQVLATIEVIPDQIEIDRLKRQISRLQSRLVKLKEEKAKLDSRNETDPSLEREIAENERDTVISQRELEEISRYAGIVEIKAPYAGIVMDTFSVKEGDLLYPDSHIIEFANDSYSYVIVKDDKNQLNYGNDAEIRVSSSNGSSVINGKVVSLNKLSLSNALKNDYSLVAIPQEELASIAGSTMVEGGRWDRNSFKVKVRTRSEKNVLIVPKSAVTVKDKSAYVTVVKEDGSVEQVSFIPGGSDTNYYWIAEGLEEGMTVCWE